MTQISPDVLKLFVFMNIYQSGYVFLASFSDITYLIRWYMICIRFMNCNLQQTHFKCMSVLKNIVSFSDNMSLLLNQRRLHWLGIFTFILHADDKFRQLQRSSQDQQTFCFVLPLSTLGICNTDN